ncbi:MAG: branched-chain amino acid ABC transporter permease [Nitrospinota bacterium]|nr:MAG: branched-chain amino acid ABC transporter permease [Nitrospinota bacterium]
MRLGKVQLLLLLLGVYLLLSPLPLWAGEYYTHIFVVSLYYVILAASWNLLAGYTGQFSLAHHAFAAMGGYTSALLARYFQVPLLAGIATGGILAMAVGYFLGTLCLRMRAIYLALATWAFAETFRILIAMEYQITRGDLGLSTPLLFGTPHATPYFYLFLFLTLFSLYLMYQIVTSRIGYYMRAIRDDEEAAVVMGVDTVKWKRFVFAVSSLFAGIAGGFYAHYIGLLSPVSIRFNEMALIIIMVIIGGLRSFLGPIIGAVFIEILSELLRQYGEIRMVLFALLVILIMRVYREGIMGMLTQLYSRIRLKTGQSKAL